MCSLAGLEQRVAWWRSVALGCNPQPAWCRREQCRGCSSTRPVPCTCELPDLRCHGGYCSSLADMFKLLSCLRNVCNISLREPRLPRRQRPLLLTPLASASFSSRLRTPTPLLRCTARTATKCGVAISVVPKRGHCVPLCSRPRLRKTQPCLSLAGQQVGNALPRSSQPNLSVCGTVSQLGRNRFLHVASNHGC